MAGAIWDKRDTRALGVGLVLTVARGLVDEVLCGGGDHAAWISACGCITTSACLPPMPLWNGESCGLARPLADASLPPGSGFLAGAFAELGRVPAAKDSTPNSRLSVSYATCNASNRETRMGWL